MDSVDRDSHSSSTQTDSDKDALNPCAVADVIQNK